VHEAQRPPHGAGVDQEATTRRSIERADHDRLGQPHHVEQHVFVEVHSEHRCSREHLGRVLTDGVDPAPDDIAQARRHGVAVEAGFGPVPDELRCEQRVAGGLYSQHLDDLRRAVGGRRCLRVADSAQMHVTRAVPRRRGRYCLVLSSRDPPASVRPNASADGVRRRRSGGDAPLQLVELAGTELHDLVSAPGGTVDHPQPAQIVEVLRIQTAGNPLFASQLIRHWTEAGFDRDTVPPSLRDVVWSRVNTNR